MCALSPRNHGRRLEIRVVLKLSMEVNDAFQCLVL